MKRAIFFVYLCLFLLNYNNVQAAAPFHTAGHAHIWHLLVSPAKHTAFSISINTSSLYDHNEYLPNDYVDDDDPDDFSIRRFKLFGKTSPALAYTSALVIRAGDLKSTPLSCARASHRYILHRVLRV